MTTDYTQLPLKDLERLAYREQNALALAIYAVMEGQDESDDLREEVGNLERSIDDLNLTISRLEDDLAERIRMWEEAEDELATVRADLDELKATCEGDSK